MEHTENKKTHLRNIHCPTDMSENFHICCRFARPGPTPSSISGIACSVCTVDLAFLSECNAVQRDINTIPYVYAKVNEIVTDCLLLEKIRINYTRKMRINLLLPRMGKKITGIRLSPNTRYRVYRPRLIDAIIVIS